MRNRVFTAARDAIASPQSGHVSHMDSMVLSRVLCAGVFLCTLPFFVLLCVLTLIKGGDPVGIFACAAVIGGGLLLEVLFAVVFSWLYPVRVSDEGVSATDFWGRRITLSWGEIENATPVRFMNLPYVKVASFRTERAVLWLPLFVRKPDALRDAIRCSASANNPLRRFIEEKPTRQREPLTG